LYTSDAVSAILTVLLNGISGEAYNAANEDTYCSVYDMAKMVVSEFADKGTHVKVHIDDEGKFGYAPVLKMNLDTSKLQKLGWTATTDLREMFLSLLKTMEG
jgi:nucleoside-diphosphate-sugar epimerase